MYRAFLPTLGLCLLMTPALGAESDAPFDVSTTKPKLMGGTVTLLDEALDKTREGVANCIASNGGLMGSTGKLDVQFLVRDRGRAEGVEAVRAQRVSGNAATCVRKFLRNRHIGTPSDDPVGVVFTYTFKRR